MKTLRFYSIISFLFIFAILTFYLSSSIIFDWFQVRENEGKFVLFVVWANLFSSIIYLISVYAFLKNKKWTYQLLAIAAIMLCVTFLALMIYIQGSKEYETKTIYALIFRISVTIAFMIYAYFRINKNLNTEIK